MNQYFSQRLISGTFIQLDHWSDSEGARFQAEMRKLTPENWVMLIDDMHEIGIDTLVLQQCVDCRNGWENPRSYYPSNAYKMVDWLKFDNMGVIVERAEELNMKVIFGIGVMYTKDPYLFTDEVLAQAVVTAKELYQLYGEKKCFGGWYWTYEYPPGSVSGRNSLQKIVPEIRKIADCDFMLAPNIDRLMTPVLLQDIDVDIIAYQDGVGLAVTPDPLGRHVWGNRESVLHRLPEYFQFLRRTHDCWYSDDCKNPSYWNCYFRERGRTAIWNDLEIWEFDHNKALLPTEISRLVAQLELSAPYVDKQIIYQYPGLMNNPKHPIAIGGERAQTLYTEYKYYRDSLLDGSYISEPEFVSKYKKAVL